MAAVADIAVLGGGLLDRCRLEIVHLMPVGSDRGMTGQAIVREQLRGFRPGIGQAHVRVFHLPVAHQADIGMHGLAQGKGIARLSGRRWGFLARIVALVAGRAFHVHQLLRQGAVKVASMEIHLRSLIGGYALIPGLAFRRFDTGGRARQNLLADDFLMTSQALLIGGRVNGRFEVNRIPLRTLIVGLALGPCGLMDYEQQNGKDEFLQVYLFHG